MTYVLPLPVLKKRQGFSPPSWGATRTSQSLASYDHSEKKFTSQWGAWTLVWVARLTKTAYTSGVNVPTFQIRIFNDLFSIPYPKNSSGRRPQTTSLFIRVRSRRFSAHLNRTGEKPNFGLVLFCFFPFSDFSPHFSLFFPTFFPKKLLLIILLL